MTDDMVILPAFEVLEAALMIENEWGFGQLGPAVQALLDANREFAKWWCSPFGYIEELDGPRGERPALVLLTGGAVALLEAERDSWHRLADAGRERLAAMEARESDLKAAYDELAARLAPNALGPK